MKNPFAIAAITCVIIGLILTIFYYARGDNERTPAAKKAHLEAQKQNASASASAVNSNQGSMFFCQPGDSLQFHLMPGQATGWIHPTQGMKTKVTFLSTNSEYVVMYRDGRVFKATEHKPMDNEDFRILALKDTIVKIVIERV